MKLRPDERYFTASVYAFGVVMFTVAWILLLANGGSILRGLDTLINVIKPLIYGLCFAYLLFPAQRTAEQYLRRLLRKKERPRLTRILSVILTYVILLAVLVLVIAVVLPQIVSSYNDLENQISGYLADSAAWIDSLLNDKLKLDFALPATPVIIPLPETAPGTVPNLLYHTVAQAQQNDTLQAIQKTLFGETRIGVSDFLQNMVNGLYAYLSTLAPQILEFVMAVFTETKNILLGLIISVYFLLSRERCANAVRLCLKALLPRRFSGKVFRLAGRLNAAFFRFVTDRIADVMIMFLIYLFCLTVFGFPYAPLVGLIMSTANLIPYVGPFFCAIPAVFIVFVAEPDMALWFLLMLVVLQGLDMYLVEAKLLGGRSTLSPAWVLVAVSVMGRLFGMVGFLVAVPLTSVIYTQLRQWTNRRLQKMGMPVDTTAYAHYMHDSAGH